MGKLQKAICADFTVVHNEFLRDTRLGIEEIGMLIKMLSLPNDWNFSINGLAAILPNGKHKIMSALNKLKELGYFRRVRETDQTTGRVIDWIYEFSDEAHPEWLTDAVENSNAEEKPNTEEKPHSDLPHLDEPDVVNEPQSNTNIHNTKKSNTDMIDREQTEKIVSEQISVEILKDEYAISSAEIDEFKTLIVDTYLSTAASIRINGSDMPTEVIKKSFSKITYDNILYITDNIKKSRKKINNMRTYLISALYNSTTTLYNHISADFYSNMNLGKI